MFKEEPKIVNIVVGFIIVGGLILMLKKSDRANKYPGKWCLPGGGVKKGENPRTALFRKVKEGAGLHETPHISFLRKYIARQKKDNIVLHIRSYLLEYGFPIRLSLSDDFSDVFFATPNEIMQMEFAGPITATLIGKFIAGPTRQTEEEDLKEGEKSEEIGTTESKEKETPDEIDG